MCCNQLFHADISAVVAFQIDDGGYDGRHGNDGEYLSVFDFQHCTDMDRFVGQMRKRMVFVYYLRGKHRLYVFAEILFELFLFTVIEFPV